MLTPQEVSEHAFSKAGFGGYNMAMVDEFLDLLTADYTSLYNENAVLKSKMKVLADKVEEYRSTEEAMRKALLTAQRLADDMVKEAEAKKASLLREAESDAQRRIDQLHQEIQTEELRLSAAQQATAEYVSKVRAIHQQGLAQLDGLSSLVAPAAAAKSGLDTDPVSVAAMEIEDTIQKLMAEEMPQSPAPQPQADPENDDGEEEPAEDTGRISDRRPFRTRGRREEPEEDDEADDEEPEDGEPTRRINFDNLQFGRDFENR